MVSFDKLFAQEISETDNCVLPVLYKLGLGLVADVLYKTKVALAPAFRRDQTSVSRTTSSPL